MPQIKETTISVRAEEKVGLPNYSNVTIESSASRTYEGAVDEIAVQRELGDLVESFVAAEREAVLASIQGK